MSKQKPLPPRREASPPLPPGGSSTGRPVSERVPQSAIKELQQKMANQPMLLAPRMELMRPEYEHDAIFCPAREDAFAETAIQMEKAGWELVSVVPQQRHVSNSNGSGMMQGWMTFWKRVKKEEKTS